MNECTNRRDSQNELQCDLVYLENRVRVQVQHIAVLYVVHRLKSFSIKITTQVVQGVTLWVQQGRRQGNNFTPISFVIARAFCGERWKNATLEMMNLCWHGKWIAMENLRFIFFNCEENAILIKRKEGSAMYIHLISVFFCVDLVAQTTDRPRCAQARQDNDELRQR